MLFILLFVLATRKVPLPAKGDVAIKAKAARAAF